MIHFRLTNRGAYTTVKTIYIREYLIHLVEPPQKFTFIKRDELPNWSYAINFWMGPYKSYAEASDFINLINTDKINKVRDNVEVISIISQIVAVWCPAVKRKRILLGSVGMRQWNIFGEFCFNYFSSIGLALAKSNGVYRNLPVSATETYF